MTRRLIALTMGDAAGIGPEIATKCFDDPVTAADTVVYGDAALMQRAAKVSGVAHAVRRIDRIEDAAPRTGRIDVLQIDTLPPDLPFGRIDARAGRASHACLLRAIDDAKAGRVSAIVTAPIHKEAWHAAGIRHPGHTEVLAEAAGTEDFAMMLFNDDLRVMLVSIHVALREAIALVTPERELKTIRLADRAARQLGIAKPRVAVAGLNPHAGEGGQFGREDRDVIAPAIAAARAAGIDASGPWPPDTVFMQARAGRFDIVVAQYHDQGLIPLKYLGVDHGVNVTVGLPFVRTSVDHGTAFDLAGTGKASAASLALALRHARAMLAGA
jgi:4-hydroxythreonine-4-phosphate dehydrogenase